MASLEGCLEELTPEEWFALIRADEDGPLPPCCTEVSDLRDTLIDFARLPTHQRAIEIVRVVDGHGVTGPVARLRDALVSTLDAGNPQWREVPAPTRESIALLEARLVLRGRIGPDSPPWNRAPREDWQPRLEQVLGELLPRRLDGDEMRVSAYLEEVRAALAEALDAGADPRALLALYDVAQALVMERFR